jgi:sarcosine oxidase subunit gamma
MLNLTGEKIYDLFMKGSPFNFNEFKKKKGAVTQTIINKIDVIIHNKSGDEINLFVRRSFSNHLWSWLNDSARFI